MSHLFACRLGEEWKPRKGVKRPYPGHEFAPDEDTWSRADDSLKQFGFFGGIMQGGGLSAAAMMSRASSKGVQSPAKKLRVCSAAKHLSK